MLAQRLAHTGTWEWDLATGGVHWSDEVLEFFGFARSEFDGSLDTVEARIHPEDRPLWKENVRQCLEEGREHRIEFRVVRPDRSVRWLMANGDAERDANGHPLRLLGVVMDITEKKELELAQRQSAERFRSLMEHTAEGFYLCEFERPVPIDWPRGRQIEAFYRSRIVECNEAQARMYGYESADQVVGSTVADLHGRDDNPNNLAFFRSFIDHGYRLTGALTAEVDRDGNPVWFSNNVSGIVESGCLVRVWGTQTDVTEVYRTRAAVQREQHLTTVLVDSVPGIFYQVSSSGRILRWNRGFEKATGHSSDEIPNLHFEKVLDDRSLESFRTLRQRAFDREQAQCEATLIAKDGRATPYFLTARRFQAEGEDSSLIGMGIDITQLRQVEADRETLRAELEQSRKLESIGRLAGGVAHDLNNLLTPVIGYSEMLGEHLVEGDDPREFVEAISKAGLRARDLVRQLLAFGRRQTLNVTAVDLSATVQGFESLLRRTTPADIDVRMDLAEALPPILADAGQIEQILLNLTVNAADAMPSGGRLLIETDWAAPEPGSEAAAERGLVKLVVTDTGQGMDEDVKSRIFEPFFSTKGELGTGLGLATVYGIVQQHGGGIRVSSKPGVGTTFEACFPIADVEAAEEPPRTPSRTEVGGTERILLVEDDPQVRTLTSRALRRFGYTVIEAADGAEALRALEHLNPRPDLVLSDVVLPGLNGKQIAQALEDRAPNVPVLFMSGYPAEHIATRGILDRGVQFIPKPFVMKTLAEKVREVLDRG